jgi:hypothetical protein
MEILPFNSTQIQSMLKKQPDKTVGSPSVFTELVTILDKPLPSDTSMAPLRSLLNIPYDETKHDYQLPWHWPFARIHQIFVDSHSTNNWVARQL